MKKLLIVDGDRHLLDSLRVVFSDIYEVSTALFTEDAERFLETIDVDVVLLDVVLPGTDGIKFLKKMNATYPGLPVVMICGAPSIRPVIKALELDACDYIRKPFDIEELRLVVGRAIKNVQLKRRIEELERQQAGGLSSGEKKPLKQAVEEYERSLIKDALDCTDGVQTRAAAELGTTRRILRYRIEKLNITP